MDRRRNPRVIALLSVRVWGIDAHALPFTELASVRNISRSGAVLRGVQRQIRAGTVLEVQFGEEKAQFRVVWTGKIGTRRQGEVGIERLPSTACLWNVDLCQCGQMAGKA